MTASSASGDVSANVLPPREQEGGEAPISYGDGESVPCRSQHGGGGGSGPRAAVVAHLKRRVGLDDLEARDAEIGVYNASLRWADRHDVARTWSCRLFFDAYLACANSVLDNLDPATPAVGNVGLLARVRGGELAPHDVAFLPPHAAFPERWREVLEAKVQRDEYTYNRKPEAMTDQYKCKRCHKRECVYYEQQTRSCDEPMSLFITCISCGNRWRMG